MELKMSSKLKWILFAMTQIVIFMCVITIARTMKVRQHQEYEEVKFQYSNQVEANYEVNIKENPVYDDLVMEEGFVYSKRLLNHIVIKFSDDFTSSEPCNKEIEYRVYGVVRGSGNTNGEVSDYWKKEYEYKKVAPLTINKETWSTKERVTINLAEYDEFAKQAFEVTGYNVSEVLDVILEGKIFIHSSYGVATVPLNAKISIPLREDSFAITKTSDGLVESAIKEKVKIQLPVNRARIIQCCVIIGAMLIVAVFLLIFTVSPTRYDRIYKRVRRILKNYGSRIIGVKFQPELEYHQVFYVGSIDDLVKSADEIQKPIFYILDDTKLEEGFSFQLVDGNTLYVYEVKE